MILRPILFNIFISDMDGGTEHTLIRFAGDTKLRGLAKTSGGGTAVQRDIYRPSSRKGNAKSASVEEEPYAPLAHIVCPQSGKQLCRKRAEVPVGQRSPMMSWDKLEKASTAGAGKSSVLSAQHW